MSHPSVARASLTVMHDWDGLDGWPEGVPPLVDAQDTELGQRVGVGGQPDGARSFEPGMPDTLVAAFDEPAADGQSPA